MRIKIGAILILKWRLAVLLSLSEVYCLTSAHIYVISYFYFGLKRLMKGW